VLSGCKTIERYPVVVLPTLEAFRPQMVPELIAEPKTDKDLLYNLVIWEYFSNDWQDYGLAYDQLYKDLQEDLKEFIDPG
jgi:hypothetical protein